MLPYIRDYFSNLRSGHVIVYHIHISKHVPYCPAVTPPPPLFATYFQEIEGGGNDEDLSFRLAVEPPPPPPTNLHTEINEALLCGRRRELLRSTCRGSTEGWKSCWPYTSFFLQNIAGSLAARLLPLAARLHRRITCRITGLRKVT